MLSHAQRVAGITFVVLFAFLGMFFILSYSPTVTPFTTAKTTTVPEWFLSYRLFDIFFLSLVIFAAVIGASALFRPERLPEPPAVEESIEED